MSDDIEKPKVIRVGDVLCITDVFLDAIRDGIETITYKEIKRLLGHNTSNLVDTETNDLYDLTKLREQFKTKESYAIYEEVESKLLINN